ncbi:hypothetical protein FDI26_gp20 [Arthrobacter phage Beans]|uniref:Uncharacterized protein n=1 Tax=Arthrobacter phage Beans TaxID=2015815 RepID=A0A222ZKZ3_9CAUD|nr:hypothetical protein FDI26_gp20 [Arthrobacter phage Beans]ASR84700.1 hypothetical protein SEA_BEANS_20 [Arthrobacter phage Beans]
MNVWFRLIVTRVLRVATHVVLSGDDVDGMLANEKGPRLEVAEAIGRAMAVEGLSLPYRDADALALLSVRTQRRPVDLSVAGTALRLSDGRMALTIGNGSTVESRGPRLCVVTEPSANRYVDAYRLPGVRLLDGATA